MAITDSSNGHGTESDSELRGQTSTAGHGTDSSTGGTADGVSLGDLLGDLPRQVISILEATEWAEEEIHGGQQRHPHAADLIGRSFPLLVPTWTGTIAEVVYRAHARELIERVAAGRDTRPGTAAEAASPGARPACVRRCAAAL